MSEYLFFGDSITSAENNNYNGFVEKLGLDNYKNYGVSGTCFGSYSLYPVMDNNFIDMIDKHKEEIKQAKYLFIEYGCNDISSIVAKYTTINHVKIDIIKSLDYIKQLNSDIKIFFILLGDKNINTFARGQCIYLSHDYLKKTINRFK